LLSVLIGLLGLGWLGYEFTSKPLVTGIANLNTYNAFGTLLTVSRTQFVEFADVARS
jgi:hypothetical protein